MEETKKYFEFLGHKYQTEIRAIKPKWMNDNNPVASIFVSGVEEFVSTVESLNGEYNVYAGLNERQENGKEDADVEFITNIGHDIDAHNEDKNGAGNDGGKSIATAGEIAMKMLEDCKSSGLREPMLIHSGRGFWIINHIAPIPNTEENCRKIKEFGRRIKEKYQPNAAESYGVEIDSSVYNPSRIARVPGTLNISDKENKTQSYLMNNPSGEEDEKLTQQILEIEVPEIPVYRPQSITGIPGLTQGICSFMDYCLTHQIPEGERNKTINKNLAIYLISKSPEERTLLREQYLKMQQNMLPNDLDGWIKQIENEPGKYSFNIGELVNFTKKYKIPYDWRATHEYQDWIALKKSEKRLEAACIAEKTAIEQSKMLAESADREKRNIILKAMLLEAQRSGKNSAENTDIAIENIVKEIKDRMHIKTWRDDVKPEVWVYFNGKYWPNGESAIKEELRKMLGATFSTFLSNRIVERIKVDTYIDQEVFINESLNHTREVNVKNGIVSIERDAYKITLLPHDPEKIFVTQLPINYNPEAACPVIDKFLTEALSSPEDKETVYEAMGTAVDPSLITKKALIAFGPKDTGKTTWLHLAQHFYGTENCSNLNIKQLTEHAFLKSKLFGKFANISSEISSEEVKNMEEFKALTGGDFMEGDRKFKNSISFRNLAKFFFGCNLLPRIYNADDAFWGRLIVLPFTKVALPLDIYDTLNEEEKKKHVVKDEKLREKLTTPEELSGLLNKALDGLIKYYQTDTLSYSKSLEEIKMAWIKDSDSFTAFCMENIDQGDFHHDYILRKELSNRYMTYCKKNKVRTCSDKAVKATLNARYGVAMEYGDNKYPTGKKDDNGNMIYERAWEGIKWKTTL